MQCKHTNWTGHKHSKRVQCKRLTTHPSGYCDKHRYAWRVLDEPRVRRVWDDTLAMTYKVQR